MTDSKCPDRTLLVGYALGTISEGEAEIVAEHLETCVLCDATLEQIESQGDSVIMNLRQTSSPESEIESPECQAALAQAEEIVASHSAMAGLPKEVMGEGRVLGQYQLLDKLGQGGMGAVYKARHLKLKRFVAIKVLPQARMNDVRAVARFEREMEAVGRLDHPHIVRAHDACEIDGTHFLVMEYVDGMDLSAVADRLGPLSIAEACEIVRQAALGLEYVHEHNLVHRDIKPSNLMLTADGQVKVLDLGLALLSATETDVGELTSADQAMGTADYMAPEQTTDSHSVDIRADIYSLGCTLYKLLTGRAPFADGRYRTAFQKMMAHVNEPVPPIQSLRNEIRPELAAILERMLAKQPQVRYAVPGELAAALAPWTVEADLKRLHDQAVGSDRSDMAMSAGSVHRPVPAIAPALAPLAAASRAPRRYRPWIIGIVALAVLGGGIWASVLIVRLKDRQGRVVAEITAPEGTTAEVVPAEDVRSKPSPASSAAVVSETRHGKLQGSSQSQPAAGQKTAAPRSAGPRKVVGARRAAAWTATNSTSNRPDVRVFFRPDGRRVAAVCWSQVTVWDLDGGNRQEPPLPHERQGCRGIAWSPDGKQLAFNEQNKLCVWNLETDQCRVKENAHPTNAIIWDIAYSPDGTTIATGANDATALLWDAKRLELRSRYIPAPDEQVPASVVKEVSFSPDGRFFAACGSVAKSSVWATATGKMAAELSQADCIVFSPDSRTLLCGDYGRGSGGRIHWYEVPSWQRLRAAKAHDKVAGLAVSPDAQTIATVGVDDSNENAYFLRIWQAQNGERLAEIPLPGYAYSVDFSADGRHLATAGDSMVRLWELEFAAVTPRGATDTKTGPASPVATPSRVRDADATSPRAGEPHGPPLAIAPFDAREARKHQDAWAKYLGVPVEMTNSIGMKFRLIPPGEFPMGATPEELVWAVQKGRENNEQPWYFELASSATPRHRVAIRQPFYLAVFETTQTEYQAVTGKTPSSFMGISKLSSPRSERTVNAHSPDTARAPGTDTRRHPVETISWEETAEFCRRLSALPEERSARRVYRLPTEAQWEYACRAGNCGKWNVGDQEESLVDAAWFRKTSDWTTHSVGLKRPNAWGLRDMHGNVSEWCEDWFDLKYYAHSPAADPPGASTGSHRVVRGGSWVNSSFHCRSATRYSFPPAIRQHETGFRVLCEIPEARGASREANNKQ